VARHFCFNFVVEKQLVRTVLGFIAGLSAVKFDFLIVSLFSFIQISLPSDKMCD